MTVDLKGYAFNLGGTAVENATVLALTKNTTTEIGNTTTDENGLFEFSGIAEGLYDIKVSSGSSIRWRKYDDEIQTAIMETASLRVRGTNAAYAHVITGTPTATRAITIPNAAGTLSLINFAQTWSAVQTHSAAIVVTDATDSTTGGTGSIHTAGGIGAVLDIVTNKTLKPLGDTSAGDVAALGYTSTLGAILTGQGSTYDVTIVNDADATVMGVTTGTTGVVFAGVITATSAALTTPVLNTSVSGSAFQDDDAFTSPSGSKLASSESIKAYVDTRILTEDTIAELNDTNISSAAAGHILVYDNTASVWDNVALSGGTGLTATLGDGTLALAIDSTVTTLTGSQILTNKTLTAPAINGVVGGTQTSATITALTLTSMAQNWTNASRTVADMGIVTTIDINGGTIDNAAIGGTTPAAVAGTTGTFSDIVDITLVTDASDATGDTGALRTEGGASIAKKLYVGGDFDVTGNTTLNGNVTLGNHIDDVITITGSIAGANAVIFEGATGGANAYESTLAVVDPTADHTIYMPNQSGYLGVFAAASTAQISSTPEELNLLDGVSGLVQADFTKLAAVTSTAAELNLLTSVSGLVQADLTKLAAIDATDSEIDLLDGSAKSASSITIDDADAFIVIDGNTTKQIPASDLSNYVVAEGSMSSFQLEDETGSNEVTINNGNEIKLIGSGITTNWTDTDNGTDGDPYTMTFTVDAAQTGINSILAANLIIGEDAQTAIDFGTTNEIDFKADNAARLTLTSGALYPVTDNEIDLGTSGLEFKDAFFDGTVTSDAFAGPLTGAVTGNADTATALAAGVTIAMTGDVAWTSASFDGSGNVTGAGTIQANAVEGSMLNTDTISGQTEITSGLAAADELLYSDGGALKKIGLDNFVELTPALATEDAIANGDYILFLDGGASGNMNKEAVHDLATLFAGAGMTATSSVVNVIGGTGITANADEIVITPAQTTVTSVVNANLVVGTSLTGDFIDFGESGVINVELSDAIEFQFAANGAFHADGDVTAFSDTTASDLALKKNIVPIGNAMDKVMQLTGVTFDWKREDRGRSAGLIAQDVEKILPQLVKEVPALKTNVTQKYLNYNGIIGLLVEAVKELSEKVGK